VVKPHGRGEPCVWAEELRGWRRSLQDAPRGGKELETVEGRGSAPMRAEDIQTGDEYVNSFKKRVRAQGTGGLFENRESRAAKKQRGKKHMWATLMETSEPQE